MAEELAVAYVSLVPSAKGIGSSIAKELAPVEAAAASTGASSGKKLSGGFLSQLGGVGGKAVGLLGFAGIGLAAFKSAESVEAAQNTIIRSTGATGKAADSLEQSFKNVASSSPAGFQTIAASLAEVYQRTGLTGGALEGLTKQVVTFNRITKDSPLDVQELTKALAGFNVPAKDMGTELDHLFVISQRTGVPLSELISTVGSAGPILRQFGFGLDFSAGFLAQLNKAGVDSSGIMPGLRKAFVEFAKAGREPGDALRETLGQMDALLKKGDEAGARSLAVQLFGPRGAGLVDAAVSGKISLQQLGDTVSTSGKGILDTAGSTGTLSGKLGILKNQAQLTLAEFGTPVLRIATDAMSDMLPVAGGLGSALGKIAPVLTPMVLGFVAFKAVGIVIPPLLRLITTGLFETAVGMEAVGAERTASGLANFAGGLQGLGSKLPTVAAGAVAVGLGLQQAGESGTQGAIGIGEMAIGGAALGTAVLPGLGTAIGAAAGAVAGLAVHMLSGGESVEDYRKHFIDLADAIDLVGSKQAAKKFIDELGDTDKLKLFAGDVRGIKDELQSLASKSPDAANKVVAGLKAMHDESGKPLFTEAQIENFDAFIDQQIIKTKNAAQSKREADSANQQLLTGENNLSTSVNNSTTALNDEITALQNLQNVVLGQSNAQIGYLQAVAGVNDAQTSLNQAIADYGVGSQQANAAQLQVLAAQNQLAGATLTLDQATAQLDATYTGHLDKLDGDIARLKDQQVQYPLSAAALQPLIDKLEAERAKLAEIPDNKNTNVTTTGVEAATASVQGLVDTLFKLPAEVRPGVSAPSVLNQRASGGPVLAGVPYLVNENTPRSEIFVPSVAGRILTPQQFAPLAMSTPAPARRGSTLVIDGNVYGDAHLHATLQRFAKELARADENDERMHWS